MCHGLIYTHTQRRSQTDTQTETEKHRHIPRQRRTDTDTLSLSLSPLSHLHGIEEFKVNQFGLKGSQRHRLKTKRVVDEGVLRKGGGIVSIKT